MKSFYQLLLSCLLLSIAGTQHLQAQIPEIAWAKQAIGRSGGTSKTSQSVAHDASGNTYITGSFENALVFGSTTLFSSGGNDIFIAKYDPAGNVLWAQKAGGAGNDTGYGIAVDGSGNVFITGFFNGTASFGTTTLTSNSTRSDIFVAKFDTDGNILWAKQAGGAENDAGMSIAVDDTGNAYLTGYIAGTASFGTTTLTGNGTDVATFAAKYDAAGNVLWAQRFTGAGGYMPYITYGIAVDGAGNSFITGFFSGTAALGNFTLTSAGATDIYIAKLDASGSVQWARKAGGASYDYGHDIAVDGSGNAYVTGRFDGTASFGSSTLTSKGSSDTFLVKFDASGNVVWAQRSGGTGSDMGTGVAVDNAGNTYLTGNFFVTADFGAFTLTGNNFHIDLPVNDFFIAKYNASGVVEWAQKSRDASLVSSISADAAGHVYTTGSNYSYYIYVAKLDGSGNVLWEKSPAGYTSNDLARSIAADREGNTYITGLYQGTITFGNIKLNGNYDESQIFIAKYDPSGNVLWAHSAGGYFYDAGISITVDGSGQATVTGYVIGPATFGNITLPSTGNNAFVVRYDTAGNVLWAQRAGGSWATSSGHGVAVDSQGNTYITGNFSGNITFGQLTLSASGNVDAFVAKLDASGNFVWAQKAGGSGHDSGQSVTVDAVGNIYTTGYFYATATFGATTLTSAGDNDMFISKYDNNGNIQWAKSAGGTANDRAYGIAADASGNTYVTGSFGGTANFDNKPVTGDGGSDIFLAKYDASGNVQWVQKAGGTNNESGYGITADESGNAYLTGPFSGTAIFGATALTSAGSYDIFVAKYNASGNAQWALNAGGTGNDTGVSIALDGKGNAFVVGTFQKTFTLGSNTLTSNGTETFVMKIANAYTPTGISESKLSTPLSFYPNPVYDLLHLVLPLSGKTNLEIRLLDANGRRLLQQNHVAFSGEFNHVLDLEGKAKGIYLLQLVTDREVVTRRIVKE